MSEWKSFSLGEIVEFNPAEKIVKGVLAKKISMEKLQPFCRAVMGYEVEKYSGGVKFRNGDTIIPDLNWLMTWSKQKLLSARLILSWRRIKLKIKKIF